MAGPISISFIADLKRFMPGIRKMEADLDDVKRDLEDLGDEGREAERDVERAFDGMADAARDAGRRIDRDLSDELDDTGDTAREAGEEVGSEFAENIGEGLRSGDLGGVVTESLTSLSSAAFQTKNFALIGAAVGGGLIAAIVQRFNEEKERLKQVGLDAGRTLGESFEDGLRGSELRAAITDLVLEELGEGGLQPFKENLDEVGLTLDDWITALTNGGTALSDLEGVLQGVISENTEYERRGRGTVAVTNATADAAQALVDKLRGQESASETAREEAILLADALDGQTGSETDARRAIDKATRAERRRTEAMRDRVAAAAELTQALRELNALDEGFGADTAYRGALRAYLNARSQARRGRKGS